MSAPARKLTLIKGTPDESEVTASTVPPLDNPVDLSGMTDEAADRYAAHLVEQERNLGEEREVRLSAGQMEFLGSDDPLRRREGLVWFLTVRRDEINAKKKALKTSPPKGAVKKATAKKPEHVDPAAVRRAEVEAQRAQIAAARRAKVEEQRAQIAAALTPEIRATFERDNRRDSWMIEVIMTPVPDDYDNRLKGYELAIERFAPLVPSQKPEPVAQEAPQIDLDELKRVQDESAEADAWLPEILRSDPPVSSDAQVIRRFNLFVQVARLYLDQAEFWVRNPDFDYNPACFAGWNEVDCAVVYGTYAYMYRLGDDLDRLKREIDLVRMGLDLLAGVDG